MAAVFIIAPSSNHRISFRAREKERPLLRANRFAIVGLLFLALAICGVMYFISAMVIGEARAPYAAGATFVLILLTWYLICQPPLRLIVSPEPKAATTGDDDADPVAEVRGVNPHARLLELDATTCLVTQEHAVQPEQRKWTFSRRALSVLCTAATAPVCASATLPSASAAFALRRSERPSSSPTGVEGEVLTASRNTD